MEILTDELIYKTDQINLSLRKSPGLDKRQQTPRRGGLQSFQRSQSTCKQFDSNSASLLQMRKRRPAKLPGIQLCSSLCLRSSVLVVHRLEPYQRAPTPCPNTRECARASPNYRQNPARSCRFSQSPIRPVGVRTTQSLLVILQGSSFSVT